MGGFLKAAGKRGKILKDFNELSCSTCYFAAPPQYLVDPESFHFLRKKLRAFDFCSIQFNYGEIE